MSVRRQVLLASVQSHLAGGERVIDAVYLWRRHRWMVPFACLAGVVVAGVGAVLGVGGWGAAVAMGAAAASVAVLASSDYRVLARTDRDLVMLPASRIRQVANGPAERLGGDVSIEPGADLFILVEWDIDGRRYTVAKRSQEAMARIAAG